MWAPNVVESGEPQLASVLSHTVPLPHEIKSSLHNAPRSRNTFLQAIEEREPLPYVILLGWADVIAVLLTAFWSKDIYLCWKIAKEACFLGWERRHVLSVLQVLLAQITVKPQHFIYKSASVLWLFGKWPRCCQCQHSTENIKTTSIFIMPVTAGRAGNKDPLFEEKLSRRYTQVWWPLGQRNCGHIW